ncbi:hypothetical protein [Bosea sp. MMO-172]|uniref:hypothetical protein n=1 Tax=Bosea sp. MMO-172 TaxID=3127885 RepID=UPI003017BB87
MINPTIMGPAAGMVVGGICSVAFVLWVFRRDVVMGVKAALVGLMVGAFFGGFLGYKGVAWLGLVAP